MHRLVALPCAVITAALALASSAVAQTLSPRDNVLYASTAQRIGSTWAMVADTSAAGGYRLQSNDAGVANPASPLANPGSYFEIRFHANASTAYRFWMRGKALNNSDVNDSVWVQFDDSVNASGSGIARIGTTAALEVNLEDCAECVLNGWGWQDTRWPGPTLGDPVYFAQTGWHTVRVQVRQDGLGIDQIVLSPDTYFNAPPGPTSAATQVLPRSIPEIVIYAGDVTTVIGPEWSATSATGAAGGVALHDANANAATVDVPLPSPASYFEATFDAQAGVAYQLWVRGRAQADSDENDSVYFQFNGSVNASGGAVWRIGTAGATEVNLEDCSTCNVSGWGWQDNQWPGPMLGMPIRFASHGSQTLRVHTRQDGFMIDQIVLSSRVYTGSAPGDLKNDTVVVPRPGESLNGAPQISSATASPTTVQTGQLVSFTVSATDPDGDWLTYSWTFGNQPAGTSTDEDPSYAYPSAGQFTATVTVRDDAGNQTSRTAPLVTVTSTAGTRRLTFMTWNIFKGRYYYRDPSTNITGTYQCNLTEVADYIANQNVDIVSLNEVNDQTDPDTAPPAGRTSQRCSTVPEYKAMNGGTANYSQRSILENLLESMTGTTWSQAWAPSTAVGIPGGNLLLWRDNLKDGGTTATPRVWNDTIGGFYVTAAGVTMTVNSRQLTFWGTHLVVGSSYATTRRDQAIALKSHSAGFGGYHLMAGDWNASTSEAAYTYMTSSSVCGSLCFADAWVTVPGSRRTPLNAPDTQTTRATGSGTRIDYVFVDRSPGSPLTVYSANQANPPEDRASSTDHISDHIPVIAVIDVN